MAEGTDTTLNCVEMSGELASDSGSEASCKSMEGAMEARAEGETTLAPGKDVEQGINEVEAGKSFDEEAGATAGAESGATAGATAGAPSGAAAVSSIERLLQQQRNEIMFELRRLQLGERPVTGQGHKEAVESFFTSQLSTEGASNAAPQEHRPETVLVEVSALAESRPVSSLLNSSRFRLSLESALRTAIGSSSPTPRRQFPRPAAAAAAAAQNRGSDLGRNPHTGRPNSVWPAPRVQSPLAQGHRTPSSTSIATSHSSDSNHSVASPSIPAPPPLPSQEYFVVPDEASSMSDAPAPNEASVPSVQDESYPRQWLLQNVPSVSEQRARGAWEQIEQEHREQLITDISELVQRQLVTQSLQGSFRNTLEARMQDRVAAMGNGGQRVQQFIQSLQSSNPHRRNDFSELGIQDAQAQQALSDNLDNISVISATAAVTVQTSHQQVLMTREMQSLKAQIQELKNMMRMSLDVQLDTQRAIRQEVAAALAQALGSTVAPPEPANRPVDDAHCLICLEKTADSVLYQCGHLCVCHGCGLQLKQRGCHCPVCRAPIRDIIRAYKSGQQNS